MNARANCDVLSLTDASLARPMRKIIILPRRHWSTAVRLFPIIFFYGYLNLTVLLFVLGPWQWPIQHGTELYVFLALAHIALFTGYYTAAFGEPRGYSNRFSIPRTAALTVIINTVLFFPTAIFRTGSALPDAGQALANPGSAYATTMALRDSGNPVIEYVRVSLGPFTALLLPIVVFYWPYIKPLYRVIGTAVIIGTVVMFVAMGTNKAIVDTVLVLPWLIFAAHRAGIVHFNLTGILGVGIASLLSLIGCLMFFASTMSTRAGSPASYGYFPNTGMYADPSNVMLTNDSSLLNAGALGLDSYLTQGYYALYLCLKEPFVPMFGVGNSMFLTHQAARLTQDADITRLPYPARIEKYGWNQLALWSSIYPWIASDVSFPGTIIVVFLIGRIFAISWLDTLDGTNPFAVALFAQFVVMLFYFPANNQLLQSGEGLTGFVGMLCLWGLTRRKYTPQRGARRPNKKDKQ